MTTLVQIIGLGSPNGLDQVGWRLVDALGASLPGDFPAQCLVTTANCAAPALLPALVDGAGLVLLVDALPGSITAGAVYRVGPQELARDAGVASSHGIGLQEALLLMTSLSVAPPGIIIFGIGTDVAATGDTARAVETATAAAFPVLAAAVKAEIRTFLAARSWPPQAV